MNQSHLPQDVPFVTCTWSRDVHYAKALLGSLRFFHPDRRIIVIAERDLSRFDIRQLSAFPNTEVIPVMNLIRRHKLHLVGLLNKLNVLFLPNVTRVIVADADSILVDPLIPKINDETVFTALNGVVVQDGNAAKAKEFETWAYRREEAQKIDPAVRDRGIRYLQGSHFYVDAARFPYDLLMRALPFMGFDHGTPAVLRAGDQGFWNLLVNSSVLQEKDCAVVPCTAQVSPYEADLRPEWNSVSWVTRHELKNVSFLHYVGYGRRYRLRDHACPNPLLWASALYYAEIGRRCYIGDEIRRATSLVLRRLAKLSGSRS